MGVDSFSAVEAARVLKRSEKRVRQLADAGRLEVVSPRPLRVSQRSVIRMRDELAVNPEPAPARRGLDVTELVERIVAASVPKMLETAEAAQRRTEDVLREQLERERARADAAESRLAEVLSRGRRRRWRASGPGGGGTDGGAAAGR